MFTLAQAQEKPTVKSDFLQVADSIPVKKDRYGLRVGVDLTADFRWNKKYYLAAELGNENKTTEDDRLTSNSKGSYLKAGFDYNMYQNWLDMENIISVGLRYGFSSFSEELYSYKIYNAHPYWGELPALPTNQKFNGLNASWIEVVTGMKAKMFNNVFVGFSVQLKTLVTNHKPNGFDNLYIPGFNRTYNGSFGIGFNYSVSYFIPLYKKKVITK
jgi:hypothetical protein